MAKKDIYCTLGKLPHSTSWKTSYSKKEAILNWLEDTFETNGKRNFLERVKSMR